MRLLTSATLLCVLTIATLRAQEPAANTTILSILSSQQHDLAHDGTAVLLDEAKTHDFFLLGELHGETEVPQLLHTLWPDMWKSGYRHVAAEISPWAAQQLRANIATRRSTVRGLWTWQQAADVEQFAKPPATVLWGCDMEELQPQELVRMETALNPRNPQLQQMSSLLRDGYNRKDAASLFALAQQTHPEHDATLDGISLWQNTLSTFEIETKRANSATRMHASEARELLMKTQFLQHYRANPAGKVLFRFGRNHLHRGEDARGISTLGNFVAELAVAEGKSVFNVGVFAAGGKEHQLSETFDADETKDELAFELLAKEARSEGTLYDMRPLRSILHAIPQAKRTPLEVNLTYWADSYDMILCYRTVTPLFDPSLDL